jgi:quercetin dioxygenase-like cupin family protein
MSATAATELNAPVLEQLELLEWSVGDDPDAGGRIAMATSAETGAESVTIVLEVDPGKHIPLHTHSAEETLIVLNGSAVATAGEAQGPVSVGSAIVVPAFAKHGLREHGNRDASPARLLPRRCRRQLVRGTDRALWSRGLHASPRGLPGPGLTTRTQRRGPRGDPLRAGPVSRQSVARREAISPRRNFTSRRRNRHDLSPIGGVAHGYAGGGWWVEGAPHPWVGKGPWRRGRRDERGVGSERPRRRAADHARRRGQRSISIASGRLPAAA